MDYKREYLRRGCGGASRIEVAGLSEGRIRPQDMVVEGSFALLDELMGRGVEMYLASGTDQPDVLAEAKPLGCGQILRRSHLCAWTPGIRSKATVIDSN